MVLDTSALLAILRDEPEAQAFANAIEHAERRLLSAANLVEASIVLQVRHGAAGVHELDLLLAAGNVEIVPVDRAQALVAREAFRTFGKGRHDAALNFGDCFAYALASVRSEGLLYKGHGFSATDVPRMDL